MVYFVAPWPKIRLYSVLMHFSVSLPDKLLVDSSIELSVTTFDSLDSNTASYFQG